jgi:hypothetical protein
MDENENMTSRGRFLKRLGATLAAAVGMGVFASTARATAGQCCKDCNRCGQDSNCNGSRCYCFCDCDSIGPSYCLTSSAGCLSGGCIACGC